MTITDGDVVLKAKVRTQAKALAELVRLAVDCARAREPALVGSSISAIQAWWTTAR